MNHKPSIINKMRLKRKKKQIVLKVFTFTYKHKQNHTCNVRSPVRIKSTSLSEKEKKNHLFLSHAIRFIISIENPRSRLEVWVNDRWFDIFEQNIWCTVDKFPKSIRIIANEFSTKLSNKLAVKWKCLNRTDLLLDEHSIVS